MVKKLTKQEQIVELASKMPVSVLVDVNQRISDYLASGGYPEGPYIEQQIRYMKNMEKALEKKK